MTLHIALTDKEVSVDPVTALFRVSAIMSDHVTRVRQSHMNKEIDMGQGVKGRIVAVDYKTITIKGTNGERRTIPMTAKRSAMLANDLTTSETAPPHVSSSSKRGSPRKQPHAPHAGVTTRK